MFECHTTPSIKYLEGVAKLRYSLTVVAELIHYQHHEGNDTYIDNSKCLLDMAKTFCCNATDYYGSGLFLAKQIARKYGLSFFSNLINDPDMMWLVPKIFTEVIFSFYLYIHLSFQFRRKVTITSIHLSFMMTTQDLEPYLEI